MFFKITQLLFLKICKTSYGKSRYLQAAHLSSRNLWEKYICMSMEYIRKHAVRLLRLREQHTPPRSVIIIVISLQLMHFLIHTSQWKVNHYLSLSLLLLLGPETWKYTVSIELKLNISLVISRYHDKHNNITHTSCPIILGTLYLNNCLYM